MKVNTLVLLGTMILLLLATSVFALGIVVQKEHDKADKRYLCKIDAKTYLFAKYGF